MAYNCAGGCPRLQYWSNPNVTHNGLPMGTAATNDNARVLNETATTVAAFKSPPSQGPYQTRIFERATTFGNENDGVWLMADYDRDGIPDLVFIKTNNTPNGHGEVHVARGE